MNPIRRTMLCVAAGLWLCLQLNPASAQSPADSQTILRTELAKPLQLAQELLRQQQYQTALDQIDVALAVPNLSEHETFVIHSIGISAALGAGNSKRAMTALEGVLATDRLHAARRLPLMEALVGASSKAGEAERLVKWGRQYRTEGGSSPAIHVAVIQALYQTKAFAEVMKEGRLRLQLDTQSQRTSEEALLKMLAFSALQLKDDAGYVRMLEQLVTYHPKPEYWADLVARVASKPGFAERLQLDAYRLLRHTGNARDADDIVTTAQLAIKAGLPAEALTVLDEGYASKRLGAGAQGGEHEKLRTSARARLTEDDKTQAQQEAAAQRAPDGNALAGLAEVYASKAQSDKALDAYTQALARGKLRRAGETLLHQGIALLRAGQRDKALLALSAAAGDDGVSDLARLWQLAARHP